MTDQEDQADELLALCHIFDESVFTSVSGGEGEEAGGQFLWCPELPDGATVLLQTPAGAAVEQLDVKYLPPVALNFQLPADYPSRDPPQFTLSSKWLTMQQLSSLCERLDALWEENQGMVVLFLWMNFLQDEAFSFLELNFPLDLSEVLIRRGSGSEPHPGAIGLKVTPTTTPCDPRAIQDIASQGLLRLALLDFDKQERQRQFERSCFSCEVCFQEKLGVHCINFPGCEHVYCKDCMRDFFTIQIRDGNVNGLTCPALKCESQAHPSQVQNLVSPELFTRYDELLLQTGLQTMLDIVHCPRPQCQCPVIIDRERSLGSCPSCYYVFCTLCKFTYHSMAPCKIRSDELKKLREEYLAASEEEKLELERRYGKRTLRNAVEEAYSNEWLDQFSKQCPSCSAHIQKIDGCNKMTCMKCRAYFCWMCSQVLSRNNPYSHFNSPGSPCFNRLFEGTIIDDDEFDDW